MREPYTLVTDKVVWLSRSRPDLCRVKTFPNDTAQDLALADRLERANLQAMKAWLLSGRTI